MARNKFTVHVSLLNGMEPLICARPYPREDHLDPFGYPTREQAQAFANEMAARFPRYTYFVQEG